MADFSELQRQIAAQEEARKSGKKTKAEWDAEKAAKQALKDKVFYKKKVDFNRFRIVPNPANPANPFFEIYTHQRDILGIKYALLSLSTFGLPDPIVERSDELKAVRVKDGSWELGCKLEPRKEVGCYVIDRDNEGAGIQILMIGEKNAKIIIGFAAREGDITDLKDGIDVEFTGKADTFNGFACVKIEGITLSRKNSPVMANMKQWDAIKDSYPDWTPFYERQSYEQIQALLEKASKEEAVPSPKPQTAAPAVPTARPAAQPRATAPANAAFAAAFDDESNDLPF